MYIYMCVCVCVCMYILCLTCLYRWYRELVSEVVMSTVLGQRVKVQQGEGTELFNHIDAVVRMSLQLYGHVPFFLQIGGKYYT